MTHILFYDDAPFFGGHEAMTINAVACLARDERLRVGFMFHAGNRLLRERLVEIAGRGGRLELYPIAQRSRRLQNLRSMLAPRATRAIRRRIAAIDPDVVVVAQGGIEIGSLGLIAAKRAGYRTISYIPLAHDVATLAKTVQAPMTLRDRVTHRVHATRLSRRIDRYLYRLPDKIITVSQAMRDLLRAKGVTAPIVIVYNGMDFGRYPRRDRAAARRALGLAEDKYVAAMIGRIEFSQKGHDLLIEGAARQRERLGNLQLLIVGAGPHEAALRALIAARGLQERVTLLPWSEDLSTVYSAIDMVVLPSRFEGMPLVMHEALHYGLPVVASNVDGMVEILPPAWLFQVGDADALLQTMLAVKASDTRTYIDQQRALVRQIFDLEQFGRNFYAAITI